MRNICTLIFLAVSIHSLATFNLDLWVTKGNEAYLLGQTSKVKECADTIQHWLDTHSLSEDTRADYQVATLKLLGDFHYLLAESRPEALSIAEQDYKKGVEIMKSHPSTSFGMMMPVLLSRELAQVYYRQERYADAAETLEYAIEWLENLWQADVYDMPEWLTTRMTHALSIARCGKHIEALQIAEEAITESSIRNGVEYVRALRMLAKIKMIAEMDRDGALDAYKKYFDEEKTFAFANFVKMNSLEREQYWKMLRPFVADCYRLEDADAGFLYNVTLFSKGLLLQLSRLSGDDVATEEALRSLSYKWGDIQSILQNDEVAIEFIEYENHGNKQMGALVLKYEGSPQFVAMTSPLDFPEEMIRRISSTSRHGKDKLYNDERLQRMIWSAPLLQAIGDATTVYFAPDGYLHQVAIEYLPQVEDKKMFRLTSTRRMMEKSAFDATMPMLLCGAPDFNAVSDDEIFNDGNDDEAFERFIGSRFSSLKGAEREIERISTIRANDADCVLIGDRATEYAVREKMCEYSSVLISSHGDLRSKVLKSTSDIDIPSDFSLLSQNVIVGAGANRSLAKKGKVAGMQDGLLSAKEIAGADLGGCELFVLSACKSARGEITPEGVYGLQRGLKNAGVGAMVMSLWDVNDEAAAYIMEDFYAGIQDGLDIHLAFTRARTLLSTHDNAPDIQGVPKVKLLSYPQFRNAFILIDALPSR